MFNNYAYLVGTAGLATVFMLLWFIRKDLRRVMIYSGLFYLLYMSVIFLLLKLLSSDPAKAITPGYWSPPSILNLNQKTGGYGIEDAFYMFFVAAIAAGLYDVMLRIRITKRTDRKLKKRYALSIALIVSSMFYVITPINTVDFFIIFQFLGAAIIVWQRRDLVFHALGGGLVFMLLYVLLFAIFKSLFPSFLSDYYHLSNTSQVWLIGIPLEEYLYSLTLGLLWAPIYEYEFRVRDRSNKRRSIGLRRISLAAGASRR